MDNKNKDLDLRHSILKFYPEQISRSRRLSRSYCAEVTSKPVKPEEKPTKDIEKEFGK